MGYFIIFLILFSFIAFHLIDKSFDYTSKVDSLNRELRGLKVWRAVKLQKGVDPDWIDQEYRFREEQIRSAIKDADDNEMWG